MTTQLISLSPGQLQSIKDGFVKFFFSHWVRLFYTLASTLNLKEKWAVFTFGGQTGGLPARGGQKFDTFVVTGGQKTAGGNKMSSLAR